MSIEFVTESSEALSNWKRYPEYRDSGVEWLGEIPAGWDIRKMKHIAKVNLSNVDKKKNEGEIFVRLCNYVDVYYNDCITSDFNFMEATAKSNQIDKFTLRKADVIITKDSESWEDIAVPAYVPFDLDGVICGYHLAHIHPNNTIINGKYLFRSLNATSLNYKFRIESNGITRFGLGKYWIDNSPFIVPPIVEQRIIASFLDRKTAHIDTLISKKERLIALLEEKRAAIISRAVTTGLDSDVPMKDSGVEWLGEVPEHWDIWKINHAFKYIGSGTTPPTNDMSFYGGNIPWVNTSELRENIINDTFKKITDRALKEHSALELYPSGTLLIAMYGATIGRLGILGIQACTNQACCAFVDALAFDIKFIFYWLWMRRQEIIILSSGGGQPNINQEKLKEIRVPAPSLSEQRTIAEYLDHETAKIDTLIAKIREHIEKVKEYRTALISAAVTGKIDVREATA